MTLPFALPDPFPLAYSGYPSLQEYGNLTMPPNAEFPPAVPFNGSPWVNTGLLRIQTGDSTTAVEGFTRAKVIIIHAFERDLAARLKKAGVKTLAYFNSSYVPTYQAGMEHGMNIDWNYMDSTHPEWFMQKGGARIENPYFPGVFLIDIGLASYQQEFTQYLLNELRGGMWSGVMLDDVNFNTAGIASYPYDTCADRAAYEAKVRSQISYIGPALRSAGFETCCNVQHQWPYENNSLADWLQFMDAFLIENYAKYQNNDPSIAGGNYQMNEVDNAGPNGWEDVCQVYIRIGQTDKATFTVNTLLDNFNRANEGAPGLALAGNWRTWGGTSGMSVLGNQAGGYYPGGFMGSYWNAQTFKFPLAIGVTIAAVPASPINNYFQIYLTDQPGNANGYQLDIRTQHPPVWASDTFRYRLWVWKSGVATMLSEQNISDDTLWFQVGDIAIAYYDNTSIQLWRQRGTDLKQIAAATDGTFADFEGIRPALVFEEDDWRIDDFSLMDAAIIPFNKNVYPILYGDGWLADSPGWENAQLYGKGSFYLEWNGRDGSAFIWEPFYGPADPYEYKEWQIDLGLPLGTKYSEGWAWIRKYTLGLAIVNPASITSQVVTLEPGRAYAQPDGTIIFDSITMPPVSGMLLLYAN
jgi:hypothetical protein